MHLRSGRIVQSILHPDPHPIEETFIEFSLTSSSSSSSSSDTSSICTNLSYIMENLGANNGPEDPKAIAQLDNRPLRELLNPVRQTTPSCIILPLNQRNFTFNPRTIQLLTTFHGMDSKNPYTYIKEFEEVYAKCIDQNANEDIVRLWLFPFFLKEKAKILLNSLRPRSIGTWREMQAEFLKKYFPAHRTLTMQKQIMNFTCQPNESFSQAWERFKDLCNACPHHGFPIWRLCSFFYDALHAELKQLVGTMSNGQFLDKSAEEAYEFLEELAENTKAWEVSPHTQLELRGSQPQSCGRLRLNENDDLSARLASLTKKVESLEFKKVNMVSEKEVRCVICEVTDHSTDECPTLPAFKEVLYGQTSNTNATHTYSKPYQGQGPPQAGPRSIP